MDLSIYIKELLYKYDCVIIPDFGGFITKEMKAGGDDTMQRFYPPRKTVAFNGNLNQNDGLVANYISQKLSISYTDAIRAIASYVIELKQIHVNSSCFIIQGVGQFKYSNEGNICFEPDVNSNFLIDTYGMGVIVSLPVKREVLKKETVLIDRSAIKPDTKPQVPKHLKWATAIVIPVLVVMMLGVFNNTLIKNVYSNYTNVVTSFVSFGEYLMDSWHDLKDSTANSFTATKEDTILVFPIHEKKIEATVISETPVKVEVVTAPATEVKKQAAPEYKNIDGKTLIIAGCFGVFENAEALVENLRIKGYDARLAGKSDKGLFRVAIGVFNSREAAEQTLVEFKSQGNAAWAAAN